MYVEHVHIYVRMYIHIMYYILLKKRHRLYGLLVTTIKRNNLERGSLVLSRPFSTRKHQFTPRPSATPTHTHTHTQTLAHKPNTTHARARARACACAFDFQSNGPRSFRYNRIVREQREMKRTPLAGNCGSWGHVTGPTLHFHDSMPRVLEC